MHKKHKYVVYMQKQTAVTAYFKSEQLLLLVFDTITKANSSNCLLGK